jgi:hypothetical protein
VGAAFIFVPLLAGLVIVSAFIAAYAARCVLLIVQGTAAGQDDLVWPEEPIYDWLRQSVTLLALVAIWVAPAAMVARGLRFTWLQDQPALRFLILAIPGLWAIVPVGLLSSLSASSPWFFFRPMLVWNLFRIFGKVFGFYMITAVLAVLAAIIWGFTFVPGWRAMLLLAAPFSATALLLHARLLGCIGWHVQDLKPLKSKKTARKKAAGARFPKLRIEANDPWQTPPDSPRKTPAVQIAQPQAPAEEEDEWAPPTPYGVADYQPPKPGEEADPSLPVDGYDVSAEEPPTIPETPLDGYPPVGAIKAEISPVPVDGMTPRYTLPRRSSQGMPIQHVWSFPWYRETLKAWIYLTLGGLLVGGGLFMLIDFFPGG